MCAVSRFCEGAQASSFSRVTIMREVHITSFIFRKTEYEMRMSDQMKQYFHYFTLKTISLPKSGIEKPFL